MESTIISSIYIVPGHPQLLLASDQNPGWQSLKQNYDLIRKEIEESDSDLILYFSTQWLSVLGYMFQADPNPVWNHVDHNFHDLGTMYYDFQVDDQFANMYSEEVKNLGYTTKCVNYKGFPIDTGTIVAQKLLNPNNSKKASMVSCNMYAEKLESLAIGRAASRALSKAGKKATIVLVSSLSNRFHVTKIKPKEDRISSLKDDEWNRKVLKILSKGDLQDVSQVAREFSHQANGDMGFKGVWWLTGMTGETNSFSGTIFDYQPVYGTGAALIGLYPNSTLGAIQENQFSSDEDASSESLISQMNRENTKTLDSNTIDSKSAIPNSLNTQIVLSQKAAEPVGPYPHAKKLGNLIFLSGIGPRIKGSKSIPGVTLAKDGSTIINYDIVQQIHGVFNNLKLVLQEYNLSIDSLVDVQVFLTDMKKDFKKFNEVYGEYLKDISQKPTRTTIEVGSLPTPIAVEFKVIAQT